MSITQRYFNKDYWTKGNRSGYTNYNYTHEDYLNEAKAMLLKEVYGGIRENGKGEYWLEAGCAFGWVVEQLILLGIYAKGFDISKYAIKSSKKQGGNISHSVYCTDGLNSNFFSDGYYDLIYSFETAEHVAEKDVQVWLDNLYHWLRPGGKLFMTICLGHNNIRGLDDNDESHQTLQTRLWWENWLERIGFIKDQESFDKASSAIIETEIMASMETPENIIEKYGLHLFTWEKPE